MRADHSKEDMQAEREGGWLMRVAPLLVRAGIVAGSAWPRPNEMRE